MKYTKQSTAIICLSPYAGGMELDAILSAKKFNSHMKTLIVVKKNSFMHKKLEQDNLEYETIDFYKTFSFSIIINARKIIQKYGIKNVLFFGASEMKSLYFAFLGLDINLMIRHSTTKSSPKKDWFHRLIYSNVNYHISNSKHLEKNVEYIIHFNNNAKAKMIYTSFKMPEPKYIEHDKVTLVHSGRIADAKGQIDAIKACKILVDNNIDFKFYIVGGYDEEYKEKFLKEYEEITYKENIEFVGFTDDVPTYLHKSDIFIFPSYGEGLSLSFREALANNLICFSYNNTSFPELKELGLNFNIIENRSINKLSEKLLDTIQNLEIEKKIAKKNHNLIKNIFSQKQELDSYFEILI